MPLPGDVDLITVVAEHKFIDDVVPTGAQIIFRPSGDPWLVDEATGTVLLPRNVICTVDVDGSLVGPPGAVGAGGKGVKLPATNDVDLNPTGFVYDVTVKIPTLPDREWSIALPTGTPTVDLYALAPVTPVEGGGTPTVLRVDGVSPDATGNVILNAKRVKTPATLADGPTIATDASLADLFRVTLAGNRTLSNPTNPTDGQIVRWEIKQDVTGGRTLALGNKFVFGTDLTSVALSTAAGTTDILAAVYNADQDEWRVIALAKGF